jgi:AcrR family transcriptional regulator
MHSESADMKPLPPPPSATSSRGWIVEAFNGLFLERRYGDIRVGDIVNDAGVGRSTFYEHFRSKDDVFRQSVAPVLEPMADAVTDDGGDLTAIEHILRHFLEYQKQVRAMLGGESACLVTDTLADMIEQRLSLSADGSQRHLIIPIRLAALQIAESQLGLVRGWLQGEAPCEPSVMAEAIRKSAKGTLAGLKSPT